MRAAGAEYSPEVDVFAGFRPLEGHLQASWDHGHGQVPTSAGDLHGDQSTTQSRRPSALVSQKICIPCQSTTRSLTGTLQLVTRAMLPSRAGGAEARTAVSSFCSGLVSGIRRPDRL